MINYNIIFSINNIDTSSTILLVTNRGDIVSNLLYLPILNQISYQKYLSKLNKHYQEYILYKTFRFQNKLVIGNQLKI